jgi:hypothetical protein
VASNKRLYDELIYIKNQLKVLSDIPIKEQVSGFVSLRYRKNLLFLYDELNYVKNNLQKLSEIPVVKQEIGFKSYDYRNVSNINELYNELNIANDSLEAALNLIIPAMVGSFAGMAFAGMSFCGNISSAEPATETEDVVFTYRDVYTNLYKELINFNKNLQALNAISINSHQPYLFSHKNRLEPIILKKLYDKLHNFNKKLEMLSKIPADEEHAGMRIHHKYSNENDIMKLNKDKLDAINKLNQLNNI